MSIRAVWPLAVSCKAAMFGGELLSSLQKANIRFMELSSGEIEPFTEKLDYKNKAKDVYRQAKSYDVTISSIHLPFLPFSEIDPATSDKKCRDYIFSLQSELIRAAADSGVEIAVIHPSAEPYLEEERAERMKWAIDMIGALTKVATEAGMVLALENLPRHCLCRTHAEMQQFLAVIPDLRVCFDTNHNLLEPNAAFMRAVGEKIVTLHISDYDFVDERHWFPMDGKIDWKELLAVLDEIGYRGRFTYETMPQGKTYDDLAENYNALMKLR